MYGVTVDACVPETELLLLRVDPVLNVDARGPVRLLVRHAPQPAQEGGLAPLPVADEEQLDGAVVHRSEGCEQSRAVLTIPKILFIK